METQKKSGISSTAGYIKTHREKNEVRGAGENAVKLAWGLGLSGALGEPNAGAALWKYGELSGTREGGNWRIVIWDLAGHPSRSH